MKTYWVLRQNYSEKTNQAQMRDFIKTKCFISCPWGGWGNQRQNVVNRVYNETRVPDNRPSRGQDRRFVEDMKIGDIVLIPFTKGHGHIVARIISDVEYDFYTGLFWSETGNQIAIRPSGDHPFSPIGRRIEILSDEFHPNAHLGQLTLCKLNSAVLHMIQDTIENI